jgi:glucokinase
MNYVIGIDVGGTKIAAGVVDLKADSGEIVMRAQRPTAPERGGDAVLNDVLAMVCELSDNVQRSGGAVSAIGLGVCELVDLHGEVMSEFTVAWRGVPVQAALSQIAPAVVQADVRAHALGEAAFGAGRDVDPVVFASVGTGISACLVQRGVPYAGARGNALVLATGPISIAAPDGALHSFVLEDYASGAALAQRFGVTRTEEIFAAAEKGDVRARQMLHDAGWLLGGALGWLASVLDPAAIVVGGGLGSAPGPYWDALVKGIRAHIWSEATRALHVRQATLGNDAGIIGAALYGARCATTAELGMEGEQ